MLGMSLPVALTTALSSADELSWMLERVDVARPDEAAWVAWQAEMLQHWAVVLALDEDQRYPALAAGLGEFATTVLHQLDTHH